MFMLSGAIDQSIPVPDQDKWIQILYNKIDFPLNKDNRSLLFSSFQ